MVCFCFILQWYYWKRKALKRIACTMENQPLFYWSCLSKVIKGTTPLTPTQAELCFYIYVKKQFIIPNLFHITCTFLQRICTETRFVLNHGVVIFFWSSGITECTCMLFTFKMEFRLCARGRQWCGIIHHHWWTASIKPRLLFSRAGYASWGISLIHVHSMIPEDQKNITTQWCSTGRTFTAATQALNTKQGTFQRKLCVL